MEHSSPIPANSRLIVQAMDGEVQHLTGAGLRPNRCKTCCFHEGLWEIDVTLTPKPRRFLDDDRWHFMPEWRGILFALLRGVHGLH